MKIDKKIIKELSDYLDEFNLTEIKYGDNDRLASRVTQITNADCLILLSDVDGLYTDNPKNNKKIELIKTVKNR